MAHGEPGLVDLCLANCAPLRPELVEEKYRREDAVPLTVDRERIAAMGLELVERPVAWEGATLPATTRRSWPGPSWRSTAAGRCASSGASAGIYWRSDHVLCWRGKDRAVPRPPQPPLLRAGRGLRGVALLQRLSDQPGAGWSPSAPPFAQRLPALFKKAFHIAFDRLPDGAGKAVFVLDCPGEAGRPPAGLRDGRGGGGPPRELRRAGGDLLPGLLSPGGLSGRRVGDRPPEGLSPGAVHLPPQRQPGGAGPHAGAGPGAQVRPAQGQLGDLLQTERSGSRISSPVWAPRCPPWR